MSLLFMGMSVIQSFRDCSWIVLMSLPVIWNVYINGTLSGKKCQMSNNKHHAKVNEHFTKYLSGQATVAVDKDCLCQLFSNKLSFLFNSTALTYILPKYFPLCVIFHHD